MLQINDNAITVVRKDTGVITFAIDNYTLVTGDKLYFTVAAETGLETPTFQIVVTEFTEEGAANISLSSTNTDLDAGTYYYDIQLDRADGQRDTLIGPAKFKVIEGVTY